MPEQEQTGISIQAVRYYLLPQVKDAIRKEIKKYKFLNLQHIFPKLSPEKSVSCRFTRKRKKAHGKSSNPPQALEKEAPLVYLALRYSSIALAALRAAPMARMTVAAPETTSPPANTPGREVLPVSSATMQPLRLVSSPLME